MKPAIRKKTEAMLLLSTALTVSMSTLTIAQTYTKNSDVNPQKNGQAATSEEVRRFEEEKIRREEQKVQQRDGIARGYASTLRPRLEKAWSAPQHTGLLVSKRKIVLDQTGKVIEKKSTQESASKKEEESIDTLLGSFTFVRLPAELEKIELNLSFMSDGNMNMVEISTPSLWDPENFVRKRKAAFPDVDFGPYMADLQRRIKRAWFPPKGEEMKRVVVVFRLGAHGELLDLRLDHSSGSPAADEAAMNAMRQSKFRPLPEGAKAPIDIQFTFDYSVYSGGGRGVFRQF